MSAYSTLKRGGRLRTRSAKRVKEDAEFSKVRADVMARDRGCQFPRGLFVDARIDRCDGPLDPHHLVPVGRDVTLRLEPTNLKVLCRHHHDWVHDNPAVANSIGLLRRNNEVSWVGGDPYTSDEWVPSPTAGLVCRLCGNFQHAGHTNDCDYESASPIHPPRDPR